MSLVIPPVAALRASKGACGAAFLLMVWTAGSAVSGPSAAKGTTPAVTESVATDSAEQHVSDADLARTVAHDLFAQDRSAPAEPYRIGAAVPVPVVRAGVLPAGEVRLIGTIIAADGKNFAMCQLGNDTPKIVYAGGRIGALTLRSIEQGSAVFTDSAGTRVVLRVPKGG